MDNFLYEQSDIYRKDEIESFFGLLQSARSFFVIGAPSMGKTRFIDSIVQTDIQNQYLTHESDSTLLVRVDLNRLSVFDEEWAFYELLLSSVLLTCYSREVADDLKKELMNYDAELIQSRSSPKGISYLDLALKKLCKQYTICILIDEFDEIYRTIAGNVLDNLRVLRDANRYRLCYALFLRELPEKLRDPSENEKFYSMFSRLPIVLGPHNSEDSKVILQRIELRRNHALSNEQREWIYFNSGGHPGLILSLFSLLVDNLVQADSLDDVNLIANQNIIYEENRKIWYGLSEEDKLGLIQYAKSHNITSPMVYRSLQVKGLLGHPGGTNEKIFSPIFHSFVNGRENLGDSQKEWERAYRRPLGVFLCHASEDKPMVRELNKRLSSEKGIDPWLDENKIFPGANWKDTISQAIKTSDVVIACLSRKSITKEGYVQKEIREALDIADLKPEGTIFIIPVKLEECNVPSRLSNLQWINYFEKDAYDKLLISLRRRPQTLPSLKRITGYE